MATSTIKIADRERHNALTPVKNYVSKNTKSPLQEVKESQLESLEQGIKEALLISKGEIKGTPLSEMWDE